MAQHDYDLANQSRTAFRADLNNALIAIATQNSGATAPATTYAGLVWWDTTANLIKVRNSANTAWVTVASYDGTTFIPYRAGTALGTAATANTGTGDSNVPLMSDLNPYLGKNFIIGGDFTTNPWQRGTSFTALANGTYGPDRWKVDYSSDAVVDILKTADAPTASSAHCLHADVTTADAAVAAGQHYLIRQFVEGLNIARAGFGQAGSRYVTLSFWVKSTKTGIFCVSFQNSAGDRSYVAEYTVSVTDTWEKKTVTVAVDTAGTWLYDTGIGLRVSFALATGSTYQTAAGAWTAGNYFASANQVNALDATTNNFKLALVQLEYGSVATTFEQVPMGTVQDNCNRYYELFGNDGCGRVDSATITIMTFGFRTRKRVTPTVSLFYSGASQITEPGVATRIVTAVFESLPSVDGAYLALTVGAGGMTAGNFTLSKPSNASAQAGWLAASAEL